MEIREVEVRYLSPSAALFLHLLNLSSFFSDGLSEEARERSFRLPARLRAQRFVPFRAQEKASVRLCACTRACNLDYSQVDCVFPLVCSRLSR